MTERSKVKVTTIKRAVKAVQDTGLPVERVEVSPDGNVVIFTVFETAKAVEIEEPNSWDSMYETA